MGRGVKGSQADSGQSFSARNTECFLDHAARAAIRFDPRMTLSHRSEHGHPRSLSRRHSSPDVPILFLDRLQGDLFQVIGDRFAFGREVRFLPRRIYTDLIHNWRVFAAVT